jgi:hypothetical protein
MSHDVTWPRVVKLKHPIDFGKERIEELEFRRGRAGDAKGIAFGETVGGDQLNLLASRLCGQPIKVIEMLDIDDAGEVMEIALDFYKAYLGAGRKT